MPFSIVYIMKGVIKMGNYKLNSYKKCQTSKKKKFTDENVNVKAVQAISEVF